MIKYKSICFFLIYFASFLSGCREPYDPDISKYDNILVVDGLITDREGPHIVRLSRSFAFDENYPAPEEGAVVKIIDEDLNEYLLSEDEPGLYLSSSSLKGQAGISYQLSLTTADRKRYESEWVKLRNVPEIEDLSWEFREKAVTDPSESLYGVQIMVSTRDPRNETRYYRWEWTETWEFITPIVSSIYPGEQRCWKNTGSSTINIGTTEHLTKDVLQDHPLCFISTETNKLKIRYSILVSQYSLSRSEYAYWKNLREITQNTGSLFDPTPAAVEGNIHSQDDPSLPAVGIFQASAVSRKRIFIDRSDLPGFLNIPSGFEGCDFFTTADSAEIAYYFDHGYAYVDEYVDGNTLYFIFSNSPVCFRCTLAGTNVKPDFWTEE
ncbi:MAG: DUF4249 domain-containing protein [Bacteroidales bacterium]